MIEVIVETGTYEGAWEFAASADAEPEAAVFTARCLWDEAYTAVQGCRRRITFKNAITDEVVRRMETRP